MAKFTSKPTIVAKSAEAVSDKFADLSRMQSVLDQMPADDRAKIGEVKLSADKIVISTQQVGDITFEVVERSAERVVFAAAGSPVPMKLVIDLKAVAPEQTELTTTMDVDIPPFLKPMVGGAMQKAVDQFGQLMQQLA